MNIYIYIISSAISNNVITYDCRTLSSKYERLLSQATEEIQRLTDEKARLEASASKSSIRRYVITEKAPTRAFSWLKAAFTFKTLLRHYAKQALTPQSLNMKLGL